MGRPRKIKTEVDGAPADVHQHDPQEPQVELPEFPLPIKVAARDFEKLQDLFNDGVFNTAKNTVRKDQPCDADEMVDDVVVKCPNRATLQSADINECAMCHTKKKHVKRKLCLQHAALHWGAGSPVTTQMELGEHSDEEHDYAHIHVAANEDEP